MFASLRASNEASETSQKVKRSTTEVEKMSSNVATTSRERVRKSLNTQRTESSADSDYSFESHASSSVESRSPRELEESCEVFLELPQWCKRNQGCAPIAVLDSSPPSTRHSPDDSGNVASMQCSSLEKPSTSMYHFYFIFFLIENVFPFFKKLKHLAH